MKKSVTMDSLASKARSGRTETSDWRTSLADACRDPLELLARLNLRPEDVNLARQTDMPMLVPQRLIERMMPGDPNDPLLLQFLPRNEELVATDGFTNDPLDEIRSTQAAASHCDSLLSKYESRSLIVTATACCVHCRYCFRRHFPRKTGDIQIEEAENAVKSACADKSCREVVFSGGDPLSLSTSRIAHLSSIANSSSQVRRIRFHTRFPVLLPERITDSLIECLSSSLAAGKSVILVVQANHPAEIDDRAADALHRLADAGVLLLCQSVLLRNINDSVETLAALFERLIECRVVPYYLHQLDRVAGAAHFEVPEAEGARLIDELRARLPGYAVPRYVREIPGQPSKTVLR